MKRLLLYLLAVSIPLAAYADPLGQPGLGNAILAALFVIAGSLYTIIYAFTFFITRLNKSPFPGAKLFARIMIFVFLGVLAIILSAGGHVITNPDREMGLVDVGLFLLFGGFLLAVYSLRTENARINETPESEDSS